MKSPENNTDQPSRTQEVLGTTAALGVVVLTAFLGAEAFNTNIDVKKLDPNKPCDVMGINGDNVTLRQEGTTFYFKDKNISEVLKKKLIEQRPDLKTFFENGDIHTLEQPEK